MENISLIRGMDDPQRFPNITAQEQARIVNKVLYWISGKSPGNDASLLQDTWDHHTKQHRLTPEQMAENLPSIIDMLVNTAYQDRGIPATSAYAHIRNSSAQNVITDKKEQERLRETLTPQIVEIVKGIESGEVSARDILAQAIAMGTRSNNTVFRVSNSEKIFQPGASGYAELAINDAYRLIERGLAIPATFNRYKTTANIQSSRTTIYSAGRDAGMPHSRRATRQLPPDTRPVHPLAAQRYNPSHWYNTTDMSDLLTVAQAGKPDVACMQFWNASVSRGVDKDGNCFDSVDGRAIYVLPSISATGFMGGTPAAEAKAILEKWQEENPHSKPKSISMILRVEGNHYTTLCVSPDPDNPDRADIAYVNGFGNNSSYAREDQAVIKAVKDLYPDPETKVATNRRRLQDDGSSCGPLSISHLIALTDADDPSDFVQTGDLAGQEQVMSLRDSQAETLMHEKARVHNDAIELRDKEAAKAGYSPEVKRIQFGSWGRGNRSR